MLNRSVLNIMIEMAGSCYASACHDPLLIGESKQARKKEQQFWKSLQERMLKASAKGIV
jgi:hypothetical protein